MRRHSLFVLTLVLAGACERDATREDATGPATPPPGLPARMAISGLVQWPQFGNSSSGSGYAEARVSDAPEKIWETTLPGEVAYSTPIVGGGRVYASVYGGGVVAIDANTGDELWHNQELHGAKYGTPAYADERLYAGLMERNNTDDKVMAVDATNGTVLWRSAHSSWGSIKVEAGRVYFTGFDSRVHALDAETGSDLWTADEACRSDPAISGDRIYCGGEGRLVSIDLATGDAVFTATTGDSNWNSSPSIADGRLFIVGKSGLTAHSISDGAILWSSSFEAAKSFGRLYETSPAVAWGRVFVVGENGVFAFNAADGALLWTRPGGAPGTSVAVADTRVLDGTPRLLDAATGQVVWDSRSFGASTPALVDGHFFAIGRDNQSWTVAGYRGEVPGPPPVLQ